jgi:large subunit ribosomal protein L24
MSNIVKDSTVKIISGSEKGKTGKVLKVDRKKDNLLIEGIGLKKRHIRPSQYFPHGGTKDIHVAFPISKVTLVEKKASPIKKSVESVDKKDSKKTIRKSSKLENK